MNDPIKKFVQQHREAFDHLEPSADVLQRLQTRLRPTPVVKKPFFQRSSSAKWFVAAALLVGLVCTYVLVDFQRPAMDAVTPQLAQQLPEDTPDHGTEQPRSARNADEPAVIPTQGADKAQERVASTNSPVRTASGEVNIPRAKPLAERLADSTSASIRLAAILEIEESRVMDEQTLTMLARTMDHDGNTNVRLAALDILSRHLDNPAVTEVFTKSLIQQDDPLVQLGLIKVVGRIDNLEIEETLFALAQDPYTFVAVRDEAYAVLLKNNKL